MKNTCYNEDMNIVYLLIYGLATWRLSSLLCYEAGPKDLFVWIREKAGIKHDEDKTPYMFPVNFWAQLLSCIWCVSVWASGGLLIVRFFLPEITNYFALWLSLSTIAIVINERGV